MFDNIRLFLDPAVVFKSLAGAFLFLILSILVLLVCKKLKLFIRKNNAMNKFTYLYILYIPLLLMAFGGSYFAAGAVNSTMTKGLEKLRPAVTAQTAAYTKELKNYVVKRMLIEGELSLVSLKDYTVAYLTEYPFLESFGKDTNLGKIVNKMPPKMRQAASGIIAARAADYVAANILDLLKIDSKTLSFIWETNITELAEGGFIIDIMKSQIDARIKPLKSNMLKIFILLFSLPFIETLISKVLEKRNSKKTDLSQDTPV